MSEVQELRELMVDIDDMLAEESDFAWELRGVLSGDADDNMKTSFIKRVMKYYSTYKDSVGWSNYNCD